jgi:hypothetical protein
MKIAIIFVTVGAVATAGLLFTFRAELAQAQGVGTQPDLGAIKRDYRRPAPRLVENQALVDLGRDLFFDPNLPRGRTDLKADQE